MFGAWGFIGAYGFPFRISGCKGLGVGRACRAFGELPVGALTV